MNGKVTSTPPLQIKLKPQSGYCEKKRLDLSACCLLVRSCLPKKIKSWLDFDLSEDAFRFQQPSCDNHLLYRHLNTPCTSHGCYFFFSLFYIQLLNKHENRETGGWKKESQKACQLFFSAETIPTPYWCIMNKNWEFMRFLGYTLFMSVFRGWPALPPVSAWCVQWERNAILCCWNYLGSRAHAQPLRRL